ncbi:HTH-type transcriptional regulator MalT [Thorsellia anophelis]|uniref:LuxR family transcriptional regulator, maltose regulon positive regulatory protein n=1 Tax=Thorsellia anophelis DSM 18579 TaxID=1123402 RepID=A0A1H9ZWJ2_9GAMM|nr:HTH-type transcriptional regulator MalT [Thorsellia anophelis]SES86112.1 LuxR family transcriptional regulator, maltose regulon positive regulatory protein [Thorsellia anophelis DSM 18579]
MLIPSKTTKPLAPANTITRQRLIELLESKKRSDLILLQAPAGFGKTTLISQWVKTLNQIGWYALDESDNQVEQFASYFISAIIDATQGAINKTAALVTKHQYASLNALFAQLFVELTEVSGPVYLVLDDYHLITNDEIHGAIRFFLRHKPAHITLVMLTRTSPPIGIAKLRVRGTLLELTHQQLAFTPEETTLFLNQQFQTNLPISSIKPVCDSVDGWPTALQLIAIKAQTEQISIDKIETHLSNALVDSPIGETYLSDYLYEEVFEPLASEIKHYLMCASILTVMSNELCKRLVTVTLTDNKEKNQARIGYQAELISSISLESLEQQGLFIYRKASYEDKNATQKQTGMNETDWFGFHPLFASFLQKQAIKRIPDFIEQLHIIAAQFWLEINVPLEAIMHAKQAAEPELLITIMQEHAWDFFHKSKLTLLESCFKRLSPSELIGYSDLVLLNAWLAQSQHRYDTVGQILNEADAKRKELGIQLDKQAQGCVDALRAQVAINLGEVKLARKFAHDALEKLDIELEHPNLIDKTGLISLVTFSRIVSHSVIGEVYHCEGQLTAALLSMQETIVLAKKHQTHHYVLWSIIQQSEILMAQGHLELAYDLQTAGFEYIHEFYLEQLPLHEFLLRIRAQLLLSLGKIDEAESAARQGLLVLSHYQPQKQLQCLAILARCGLVRGALNHAQTILLRCESLIQSDFYHQDWVHNVDKARVIFWQLSQNTIAANNWLLNQTTFIEKAGNHFTQGQSQNIVRAMILVGKYEEANTILDELLNFASKNKLVSDLNRNYILQVLLYYKTGQVELAKQSLIYALELGVKTGFRSEFIIEGELMLEMLNSITQTSNSMKIIEKDTQTFALSLKIKLEETFTPDIVQFDETLVEMILSHRNVPEILLISPLTIREWQVLGLIYSGLSNDDICNKIEVAMTTLKTHIRNIYQKINVSHRAEAISFAENLLKLK